MSLFKNNLDEITLSEIQKLIKEKVNESLYLEYKREFTLDKDEDKKEFLNDLTAMANSKGGDIIFGIEEVNGEPCRISGVMIYNIDKVQQRIENTIRDNVSPTMNYGIRFISLSSNQHVIVIRIPKSINSPHMVYPGYSFYKRNYSGKHRMEVDELRECFMTSAGYSKEAYLYHFKDELEYNKEALESIEIYLLGNDVPIPSSFEAISIGAGHIRLSAWDAIVRAGILPLLSSDVQKAIQDTDKSIRNAIRIIQMQNAHWNHIFGLDEYAKNNQMQRFSLKESYNQIKKCLTEHVKEALRNIETVLGKV